MKLSLNIVVLLSTFVASLSANARGGEMVGNGGDAVVCKTPKGITTELLDFVEARMLLPGYRVDLGAATLSVDAKVELALNRLKRLSPRRAQIYQTMAKQILTDLVLVDGSLSEVDDSRHLQFVLPKGCALAQAALQTEGPIYEKQRWVFIERKIWNALSNDHKAGLILHEVIYKEALFRGHTSSRDARLITALVSGSEIAEMKTETFVSVLLQARFDEIEIQGAVLSVWSCSKFEIKPFDFRFNENGFIEEGCIFESSTVRIQGVDVSVKDRIDFYPTGEIKSVFVENFEAQTNDGKRMRFIQTRIELDRNGLVVSAAIN